MLKLYEKHKPAEPGLEWDIGPFYKKGYCTSMHYHFYLFKLIPNTTPTALLLQVIACNQIAEVLF